MTDPQLDRSNTRRRQGWRLCGRGRVLRGCGPSLCRYSPNVGERLSEKGGRSLHSSTTDHPKALFAFRISAISTLLALLVHLFGQSRKGISPKFALRGFPDVGGKQPSDPLRRWLRGRLDPLVILGDDLLV